MISETFHPSVASSFWDALQTTLEAHTFSPLLLHCFQQSKSKIKEKVGTKGKNATFWFSPGLLVSPTLTSVFIFSTVSVDSKHLQTTKNLRSGFLRLDLFLFFYKGHFDKLMVLGSKLHN